MILTPELIITYLQSLPELRARIRKNNVFIVCPFHDDSDPSCSVNISDKAALGAWYCFSEKIGGSWPELAQQLGLPYNDLVTYNDPFAEASRGLERFIEPDEYELPSPLLPVKYGWRKLSKEYLRSIECRYTEFHEFTRLVLPIIIRKQWKAHILAKLEKEDNYPKYFNSPGTWSHKYVFPIQAMKPKKVDRIVICEGPYDAMRLNYNNIPAVAALGTSSWSEEKINLIMAYGIKKVLVCGDGDPNGAGQAFNELVVETMGEFIPVGVFQLKPIRKNGKLVKVDPGSVKQERLREIKQALRAL